MKVICYALQEGHRTRSIAQAMGEGLRRQGVDAEILTRYDRPRGDIAVSYGWLNRDMFRQYWTMGRQYIFWDLGYWGRTDTGGYHRVAVNSWDTLDHVRQHRGFPMDRFDRFGIRLKRQRRITTEDSILIAGMSGKAAWTHGYNEGQWERNALDYIMGRTLLPVNIRPKPNKKVKLPPIEGVLNGSIRMLYTHHSNAALDALILGVPCWAKKGLGVLASSKAPDFDVPYFPSDEDRRQILADAAYAQWNLDEMRSGAAWEYLKTMLK